jgi:hypothetical protein
VDEASEVERLRARVAELEAKAQESAEPQRRQPARRSVWWAALSVTLITLACVLAPLSVASVWAKAELSDTDQYVKTVAPLGEDPAVQSAIANEVTRVVLGYVDVQRLTTDALNTLAQQPNVPPRLAAALPGLSVPIVNGVENFTRTQVNRLVAGPQFSALWNQVNRVAHQQVVKLLEGNQGGAISAQDNTITLNLGPIIAQVKNRLVAEGFSLAGSIPTIDRSFVLVQNDAITQAQGFYRLLNTLGFWLPLIALALLIAGVVAARDRRRALLRGALGVTGAMLVLGVALAVLRSIYVGSTPANVLTEQAAGDVFDTLVRFLRASIRALGVLGLVVALGAFLTGPSTTSARTRRFLEGGIDSMRGGAEAAGWHTGRVGTWTYTHKRALRVTAVFAGGLTLLFWTSPTAWVVVVTALVVLLVMAVIEFLAQPPPAPAAMSAASPAPETSPGATPGATTVPRQMPRASAESPAAPEEKTLHAAEKGPTPHA